MLFKVLIKRKICSSDYVFMGNNFKKRQYRTPFTVFDVTLQMVLKSTVARTRKLIENLGKSLIMFCVVRISRYSVLVKY